MSARRLVKAIQAIPRTLSRATAALVKRFMTSLLRALFLWGQNPRRSWQGFVLPTTVLMLLMVSLTAGALTFRAYTRSTNTMIARQQQVIENSTAPAIERAKAKIEYLFGPNERNRSPRRVPTSDQIATMMLWTEAGFEVSPGNGADPYTFRRFANDSEGETRVDIDGDDEPDNAWIFPADVNGDGVISDTEYIAYAIFVDDEAPLPDNSAVVKRLDDPVSEDKARALVTRNGPINISDVSEECRSLAEDIADADEFGEENAEDEGQQEGQGWQITGVGKLAKNFQIVAFAVDARDLGRTASTLEVQQVRRADSSNKWGAWFRTDLEVSPAPTFNWNGAMHTQGSFFARQNFRAFLISSKGSCLYDDESSEITLGAADGSFLGQLVHANAAQIGTNTTRIHRYQANYTNNPPEPQLTTNTDTVSLNATSPVLGNIFLNPIELYTNNRSRHVSTEGWTRDRDPEANFDERVRNAREGEVSNLGLDDVFRADNRWGPKKIYDENSSIPTGINIGEDIADVDALTNETAGLDGFWERQAISQGLRIIVGERLELGNVFGWGNSPAGPDNGDPLYPPQNPAPVAPAPNDFGLAEQRQRRTLRDNLSAVQGTVLYHYRDGTAADATDGGSTPKVCIATTVHPGTLKTIADSRTFRKLAIPGAGDSNIMADFLTGNGTNGWQFDAVDPDAANMDTAMTNLGRFAGDPRGGAPSFTPVADANVHPYPYMSMWGDFSALRRINEEEGNDSPADLSTQDTSACTLALLAYNLKAIKAEYDAIADARINAGSLVFTGIPGSDPLSWNELGESLVDLYKIADPPVGGYDPTSLPTGSLTVPITTKPTDYPDQAELRDGDLATWKDAFNKYIDAAGLGGTDLAQVSIQRRQLEAAHRYWQVERDRTFGFRTEDGLPSAPAVTPAFDGSYTPAGGIYTPAGGLYDSAGDLSLMVDPRLFASGDYDLENSPSSIIEDKAITLALASSPKPNAAPKFPALYYIFPAVDHARNGGIVTAGTVTYGGVDITLSAANSLNTNQGSEEYNAKVGGTGNYDPGTGTTFFQAIDFDEIEDLAATPQTPGSFTLPSTNPAAGAKLATAWEDDENRPYERPWSLVLTDSDGENVRTFDVSVLDKAMYDGRELMSVRMLDLDIGALTSNEIHGVAWIPGRDPNDDNQEKFGIVYAFREDAVREDEISRPSSGGTYDACRAFAVVSTYTVASDNCYMNITADALTSTDPPLDTDHRISIKPVDYLPDPDRRPYGFRLRNGRSLNRDDDEQSGLSFISDNSVAIMGDFNLHTGADVEVLEEFSTPLMSSVDHGEGNFLSLFYARSRDNLDLSRFSNSNVDNWRPAEVLGDAVYVLSDAAKDGFIEAGYTRNGSAAPTATFFNTGGDGQGLVSYQNMHRPLGGQDNNEDGYADTQSIVHEDPGVLETPLYIDRDGIAYMTDGRVIGSDDDGPKFRGFGYRTEDGNSRLTRRRERNIAQAEDTQVNVLMISGIVPSRYRQTFGGLNNFPRMLEFWNNRDLSISGGFFQLFYSHTATAPWDQGAWEKTDIPPEQVSLGHFWPPNRIWGYDVALQYAPQPPLASRFLTTNQAFNEFYRELPIDDPYVELLRCVTIPGQGVTVDPNATCD